MPAPTYRPAHPPVRAATNAVPALLPSAHPVIAGLREDPSLLNMPARLRGRDLRLMQGVADLAEARGGHKIRKAQPRQEPLSYRERLATERVGRH